MIIPSFDLGGNGKPLHFLHANGYPPDCYKPLLDLLKTEYHVFGMLLRPLWKNAKPEEVQSWQPFSEDLLHFLDTAGFDASDQNSRTTQPAKQVIGVGHSIGAIVTLRAALCEPEKFKALVLIDPVLFTPWKLILWNLFRIFGFVDRVHPLIAGAKKRRQRFDDLESVFIGYRTRNIFQHMTDEYLRLYIEGITRKTNNGYELIYSPEWEAQIYRTGLQDFDLWRGLSKLDVPTLIIRGADTDTFLEDAVRLVKQKQPKTRIESIPGSTHLVPLEHPQEVFDVMQNFLREAL